MPTLTAEQSVALATRDVSIALAAGAGCGKTFVLTERFLSHLEPGSGEAPEPADLHQLIAITFTDAAAREMRSRIREKCRERLRSAPPDEQDYWLRLVRAIEAARVSTIHAFCASLLRQYAVAVGLDPVFGVLDQSDAAVLESEAIDDVLRRRLAAKDDDTLELAAEYGLARVKVQIAAIVARRHDPALARWLDKTPDDVVAAWRACYDRDAHRIAVNEIAAAAPIAELVELLHAIVPLKDKFIEARAVLLDLLPRLEAGEITESELATLRDVARVQGICTVKDWPAADPFDRYKKACESLRNAVKNNVLPPFDESLAGETARLGLALLRLAADVIRAYEARKAAQGVLDFDDLLAKAHRLLTDPELAAVQKQLSAELRLLLVDEFQDTDQLQVELVKALCGEGFDAGRLFFVGDIKQSIYRFRGAQPDVFLDLQEEVRESGRLPLTVNFRSQGAILHFVNALFCEAFDAYQPLQANRSQTTPEPAVEFLWPITPNKNNNRVKGAALEARREEASWIARRLRTLIDSGAPIVVDGQSGEPRPVRLGDIAVLFRALSDVQVYEEALRAYELDYYLVGGHAFYAQQEIYDVLNLLRAVASPADEIALAGALRSPLFSLEDETLYWLAEAGRSADFRPSADDGLKSVLPFGSLNAGLMAATLPAELSSTERVKTAAAAETIRSLRARKDRLPIAHLLGDALARTGYDATLLAEFLGERKVANLQKLVEQARAADRGGTLELAGFITQLAEFIARQPKEPLAATSPESADVIRLMTIHQAKGLEFPLVVVPDLDRPPRTVSPPAALHAELGPLVPVAEEEDRRRTTTGMDLYNSLEKLAELEERKRLLYVATTRAADYLILSSSLEAVDKPKSDWMKLLAGRFDLESGRLAARLPAGCDAPLVRVAVEEPATDRKPSGGTRGPDLLKLLDEAHRQAAAGAGVIPGEVAPVAVDRAARVQFSFSRLTGQLVRGDLRPFALEPDEVDPAAVAVDPRGLGSLVHAVLEHVDFSGSNGAIAACCEQLAPEHVLLNTAEAAREAERMIERLLASPRGRQLAQAAALHREVEFLLAWPMEGVDRYLQGAIDCLYQDAAGDWHLVDYKTNDVPAAAVPHVARQYEMQLYVYAMVVERSLGTPPRELVLHFLRPTAEHAFSWNDAARRRSVEMVNQAIADNIAAPTGH